MHGNPKGKQCQGGFFTGDCSCIASTSAIHDGRAYFFAYMDVGKEREQERKLSCRKKCLARRCETNLLFNLNGCLLAGPKGEALAE